MDIADLIEHAYDTEKLSNRPPRSYIGASVIGNSCEAMITYALRGYPDTGISGQLSRIFRDGHRIERQVLDDMKKAGVAVMEKDPMNNRQWAYHCYGGHAVGHADGVLEGPNGESWLLEIKSMNDARFKLFKKNGVKSSHNNYYSQMQFMMGMAQFEKGVLVSYNKNNSEYHSEILEFDEFHYQALRQKIENVLNNEARKISDDSTDWRCKSCFKRTACWDSEEPKDKTMRTCANYLPKLDGTWACPKGCQQECKAWKVWHPKPKTSST
jgi:hypothetical protein